MESSLSVRPRRVHDRLDPTLVNVDLPPFSRFMRLRDLIGIRNMSPLRQPPPEPIPTDTSVPRCARPARRPSAD